ncbi:MAG: hypothetical protein IH987_21145 [Planctomycetes bacterium]|nr:hypothetical protein [Planctomycetota bacterium]
MAEFVPDPDEQKWIEPRLAGLLGLDDMPAGDRTELFAAMRTFFHRIADQGTTVLVFEDFQWADAGLVDFVEELVDRSRSLPIFVLTLTRPDLLQTRPEWDSGGSSLLSVHLSPLAEPSMRDLVAGLAPGMPDDAVQLIAARAAGVPLYAVEFVRMLLAGGDLVQEGEQFRLVGDLGELAVPESLQAVIGARLDRHQCTVGALHKKLISRCPNRVVVQNNRVLAAFDWNGHANRRGGGRGDVRRKQRTCAQRELPIHAFRKILLGHGHRRPILALGRRSGPHHE